jgi:hypothetical protein
MVSQAAPTRTPKRAGKRNTHGANSTCSEVQSIGTATDSNEDNSPEAVVNDITQLLAEYHPVQYSETHHRRIEFALELLCPILYRNLS